MEPKHTKTTAHKTRIRTLLMFLLSLFVTFGGWIFTKHLLKYKEAQLLAGSGQLQVADSVYSLRQEDSQNAEEPEATDESDIFHGETISEDVMAQILDCWESSGHNLLSHDPQKGQMNMEQAITAGIHWIRKMSEKGFFPSEMSEHNFRNVSAILYTLEEKPDIPDHLLSRWLISYTINDIRVSLTIHAATGQVWQADLYIQSGNLPDPFYLDDEILLKAAFPFLTGGGTEVSESIDNGSYKIRLLSANGKIAAVVHTGLISENTSSENYASTLSMITLKLVSSS